MFTEAEFSFMSGKSNIYNNDADCIVPVLAEVTGDFHQRENATGATGDIMTDCLARGAHKIQELFSSASGRACP